MLKIKNIGLIGFFVLVSSVALGQHIAAVDTIDIAINKTSYIQLNGPKKPYAVHVGGLKDVVYFDSVATSNGVIWVRAGKPNVPESNMIIAAQDTVLSFILRYNPNPKTTLYVYNVEVASSKKANPLTVETAAPAQEDKKTVSIPYQFPRVAAKKNFLNLSKMDGNVTVTLENIVTDSINVYFKFEIANKSKIDFDIDAEFLFLKTKSKNNRKTVKSNESALLFVADSMNLKMIPADKKGLFIYQSALNPIRKDENIVYSILERSKVTKGRQIEIVINPYIFYKMQKID